MRRNCSYSSTSIPCKKCRIRDCRFFIKCAGHSAAADARQVNPAVSIKGIQSFSLSPRKLELNSKYPMRYPTQRYINCMDPRTQKRFFHMAFIDAYGNCVSENPHYGNHTRHVSPTPINCRVRGCRLLSAIELAFPGLNSSSTN